MMLLEISLSILSAAGLLALGWMLFGRLVAPVGGSQPVAAVLHAEGDAEGLEHTVNGLLWLTKGEMARFDIVIADAGLSEAGRKAATLLAEREPRITLCDIGDVTNYI